MTALNFGEASQTPENTLQWLLNPVTPEVFFREYWEIKPLVINRCCADYFDSILSTDEIDHVITALNLRYPQINMTNASGVIARDDYTSKDGVIDVAKLYQMLADGTTVIINQLHTRVPSLAKFCRALEMYFSAPFQTNIYLTAGYAKGFKPHYDTHDVFIAQIANSKHWKLYESPMKLPLGGQEFDSSSYSLGAVGLEFELSAGDTAYIPRGTIHDAQSGDSLSTHITVGVLSYTWTNLLLESLSAVSLSDSAFRKALPIGFANPDFDRTQLHNIFRELLEKFVSTSDPNVALDSFVDEFVSTRPPLLKGQMAQINELDNISAETLLGVRPGLIYRLRENNDAIRIACYGKEITLPAHVSEPVRFALSNSCFTVRDIDSNLDDTSKLVLIRRLIREGLIMRI